MKTGKDNFVTLTSSEKGIVIYLEGKRIKSFPGVHLIVENDSILGKIILLGNSPEGRWPWSGDLFGLALYGHVFIDTEIY